MDYENLYMAILKIGQNRLETGISYQNLIIELKKEGFVFNNSCIQRAVKHWFLSSFHHIELHEYDSRYIYKHFDQHMKCNFVLKGEACLKLLEYDNMNKAIQLSERSMNTANQSIRVAIASIMVAIIVGVFGMIPSYLSLIQQKQQSSISQGPNAPKPKDTLANTR